MCQYNIAVIESSFLCQGEDLPEVRKESNLTPNGQAKTMAAAISPKVQLFSSDGP